MNGITGRQYLMDTLIRLGSLHKLRGAYNERVDKIQELIPDSDNRAQAACIETYKDLYQKVDTQNGITCNACGMNKTERSVITEWYKKAIQDMDHIIAQNGYI